jgi:23S rRNA pseudouridine2605 synthase
MSKEKTAQQGERIAKKMARAGLCSRREAERWIEAGRVQVNGKVLESASCVVTDQDKIVVDGKVIGEAEATRLFMFHKPTGVVTTAKDEQGRRTVYDVLPNSLPRLVTVGRLDMNTEGLLLLTNDGELSRYLELPATGWRRRYRVRVHGRVNEARLKALAKGTTIEGVRYKSIEASIDKDQGEKPGANTWLSVVLTEGKNREVRRVMESLGLTVNRLIRVSYGPFNLGKMPRGAVEEVKPDILKHQIAGYFNKK